MNYKITTLKLNKQGLGKLSDINKVVFKKNEFFFTYETRRYRTSWKKTFRGYSSVHSTCLASERIPSLKEKDFIQQMGLRQIGDLRRA